MGGGGGEGAAVIHGVRKGSVSKGCLVIKSDCKNRVISMGCGSFLDRIPATLENTGLESLNDSVRRLLEKNENCWVSATCSVWFVRRKYSKAQSGFTSTLGLLHFPMF